MKINFKFNATIVDEIEQAKNKLPIENIVTDTTLSNLALFVMKASVNDDGRVGCSKTVALKLIDEYLEDENNDKNTLVFDVMEALADAGFLSRQMDVKAFRQQQETLIQEANQR